MNLSSVPSRNLFYHHFQGSQGSILMVINIPFTAWCNYVLQIPQRQRIFFSQNIQYDKLQCYTCQTLNPYFALGGSAKERILLHTSELLSFADAGDSARENISEHELLPIRPFSVSVPSLSMHTYVDTYGVLQFELMHCLSVGISKLQSEYLLLPIKSESRVSTSMTTVNAADQPSSQIRRAVLIAISSFLSNFELSSLVYVMGLDYSIVVSVNGN